MKIIKGSTYSFNLRAKQNGPYLVVPFLILYEHHPSFLLNPPINLITDCLFSGLYPWQVNFLLPNLIPQPIAHVTSRPIINLQQVLSLYQ